MKALKVLLIYFLSSSFVYSQILVVKVDSLGSVKPISDQDIEKNNQQIVDILLKYTWPTCIANDLTDEEKVALLTPGNSGAELKFIRKKIKEIADDLDVVFVPTTLYELFLIKEINKLYLSTTYQNPTLFNIFSESEDTILAKIKKLFLTSLFKISPAEYVKYEINKEYNRFNNKIHRDLFNKRSVLSFHKKFIEDLALNTKLEKMHEFLYSKRYELMKKLLEEIKVVSYRKLDIEIKFNDPLDIIKKSIDLDYQAFDKNKALLFRGTNFLDIPSVHGSKKVLATTVYGTVYHYEKNISLQKSRDIPPYSLSFGNSLFAGAYNDSGACAYQYLTNIKDMGYVILIDKFAYIDNYISNLFFIASLATEVGLLGSGEWFHSRSKPTVLVKNKQSIHVSGVAGPNIIDPYGIFLIVRDPYKQAQLFSEYLAKNGVILHKGEYSNLTEEEKKGLTELIKNQQNMGIEYKVVAWFKKMEHKIKQRLNIKKAHTSKQPALA